MACINDARCDAQAERADLGMCFIRAQSGGDQMGVRLDESTLGETAVGTLALTLALGEIWIAVETLTAALTWLPAADSGKVLEPARAWRASWSMSM